MYFDAIKLHLLKPNWQFSCFCVNQRFSENNTILVLPINISRNYPKIHLSIYSNWGIKLWFQQPWSSKFPANYPFKWMKVIKKRHDTQMHFFFNFDFITAAVWQLIFAQMTFAIDRPRTTVRLDAKNQPKTLIQNS